MEEVGVNRSAETIDRALAAVWFARAAEQGNRTAQKNLAELYQLGRGVTRDVKRAYIWRVLSLQGSDNALSPALRDMAGAMNKSEIVEAERAASEWRVVHQSMEPLSPISRCCNDRMTNSTTHKCFFQLGSRSSRLFLLVFTT